MRFSDVRWGSQEGAYILLAFNCVSIWSPIPLTIRMFAAIRDKRSVYFRAMLISSWGLSLRASASLMQFFNYNDIPYPASGSLSQIGWICMVSGFAIVVWSRLGFITGSERTKRYLLWLIIFNGVVFHTTMTILVFIKWYQPNANRERKQLAARAAEVQRVFECIQIIGFNGQEILISSLYIRAAYIYLRDWSRLGAPSSRKKVRKVMITMLVIQAIVVFIDAALITIDLLGLMQLKNTIHSFVYCVKLELEVLVLNQLVKISKLGLPGLPSSSHRSAGTVDAEAVAGAHAVTMAAAHRINDVDETYQEFAERTRNFGWKPSTQPLQLHEDHKNPGVASGLEVTVSGDAAGQTS